MATSSMTANFRIDDPEAVMDFKVGKCSSAALPQRKKSARDYIGCCRRNYNGCTTTAEIMNEFRKGEG